MSRRFLLLVLPILLGLLAAPARAVIPGADEPEARTNHDRLRDELDYNRRTLIDVYLDRGPHDAAWDADAQQLLEMTAVNFTYDGEEPVYLTGVDVPTAAAMAEVALRLQESGCDDPLVLYCVGYALIEAGRSKLATEPLRLAAEGMRDADYPPMRRAKAYDRWAGRIRGDDAAVAEFRRLQREAYHEAVTWPDYEPADRPLVAKFINDWLEEEPVEARQAFVAGIEADQASDPYLRLMLRGEHEYDTAWDKRGSGFANTVKPEGWVGFEEHLTRARAALVDAYELEPGYPDAAERLIRVAMGGVTQGAESERYWFDRATEAQFDFLPAYTALMWSLRPRWGGSHEAMLALGREALDTGRWDTDLPAVYMTALKDIAGDRGEGYALWNERAVFDGIQRYYEGVLGHSEWNHDPERVRSGYVAAAARAGRFNVAAEQLALLDGPMDDGAWSPFKLAGPAVQRSRIALMTGPRADAARAAEALQEADDHRRTAEAFRAVLADLPADDAGRGAVLHGLFNAELAIAVQSGEPFELIGPDKLWGWSDYSGTWTATPDGGFHGESQSKAYRQGLILMVDEVLPPRLKLTGRVTIDAGNPCPSAYLLLHLYLGSNGAAYFRGVGFVRGHDSHEPGVLVGKFFDGDATTAPVDPPQTFDFVITWWQDRVQVEMDGEVLLSDVALPDVRERDAFRLGIGAEAWRPGFAVTYHALTVQTLTAPPAWYESVNP